MINDFILKKWLLMECLIRSKYDFMTKPFENMPMLLRFFVAHALFSIVFIVTPFLETFINANGLEMRVYEAWFNGYAMYITGSILTGIILPICGVLILKKHRYCRHLYLLAFSCLMVFSYMVPLNIPLLIFGLFMSLGLAWYLFLKPTVQQYYGTYKKALKRN